MTAANWITLSRMLGIPFVLYLLQEPTAAHRWMSLWIFLVVASTDWLDGYVARRFNQVSDLGKFLDPLVDKLLILSALLAFVELHQVPAWGVFLVLARELTIAGWRVNQTAIAGANLWGKLKTIMQIVAVSLLTIAPLSTAWELPALIAFWVSVGLTLVSGVIYLSPQLSLDE
jgi:CDP-diacylglycerol---glycerol-3-phosphate 3-phosphatidyltransferase